MQGEGFWGDAASGRIALLHTEQPGVPSLPPPGSFPCPQFCALPNFKCFQTLKYIVKGRNVLLLGQILVCLNCRFASRYRFIVVLLNMGAKRATEERSFHLLTLRDKKSKKKTWPMHALDWAEDNLCS